MINKNVLLKSLVFSLLFLSLGIIFYHWSVNSFSLLFSGRLSNVFLSIGRFLGLSAVFCVLLQLLLIGRLYWIERLFGHDKLSLVHHINGLFAVSLVVLHFFFIVLSYSLSSPRGFFGELFSLLRSSWFFVFSFTALLLFVVIVFISINLVRKKLRYESWFFIHLFVYLAIILSFFHQLEFGGDFVNSFFVGFWYFLYLFVFANFLFFRFFVPVMNYFRQDFHVSRIIKESHNVNSLIIKCRDVSCMGILPGQFVILRFFTKGRWFQAHPFTVSKVSVKDNYFRVSVKAVGDFTSEVPNIPVNSKVLVEGPFGRFSNLTHPSINDKYLLIAGGIGITPFLRIFSNLSSKNSDVKLLYSAHGSDDFSMSNELDSTSSKSNNSVVLYHDSSKKGHLSIKDVKSLVPDFLHREVFICGPIPFMNSLRKQLVSVGVSKSRIHYEKFSLG